MKSVCWKCALVVICWPVTAIAQSLSDSNLQVTTVLDSSAGLSQPTALRFLGASPNDFFVTEKATGRVKRFLNGVGTTVLDLPVSSESERGLLGMALHPNFGQTGMPGAASVYLYYSRSATSSDSASGNWLVNRLSQFNWNGSTLTNELVLATFGHSGDGRPSGPNHNGGPITFGPDGMLYGITGDLNRNLAEQNLKSAGNSSARVGGIYRITDSGGIPSNNPFATKSNSSFHRWFAYGIRNSFGLAFDPASGRLWDTENGPTAYDEINVVARGFNSGWRDIMGPNSRSSGSVNGMNLLNSNAKYSDPEFSFLDPVAVTSINFLYGSALGAAYDNKVLVGDANNGNLYMFTLNSTRTAFALSGNLSDRVADTLAEQNTFRVGTGFGVTTAILRGPDNNTYVLNLAAGEIYRIAAAGSGSLAGVPEPASYFLAMVGVVGIAAIRRKAGRNQAVGRENNSAIISTYEIIPEKGSATHRSQINHARYKFDP